MKSFSNDNSVQSVRVIVNCLSTRALLLELRPAQRSHTNSHLQRVKAVGVINKIFSLIKIYAVAYHIALPMFSLSKIHS